MTQQQPPDATAKGDRAAGFYWIRFNRDAGQPEAEPEVASWDGENWWVAGAEIPHPEATLSIIAGPLGVPGELKPDPRGPWPAGEPNEAEIRARIAHSLEEVPCSPTITRGDLGRLDAMISLFEAMNEHGLETDFYDDAWNLRNHLVPFAPGDEHYGAEGDEEEEAPDLRQWLEHDATCPAFAEPKDECTCGLAEALRRAGAAS